MDLTAESRERFDHTWEEPPVLSDKWKDCDKTLTDDTKTAGHKYRIKWIYRDWNSKNCFFNYKSRRICENPEPKVLYYTDSIKPSQMLLDYKIITDAQKRFSEDNTYKSITKDVHLQFREKTETEQKASKGWWW